MNYHIVLPLQQTIFESLLERKKSYFYHIVDTGIKFALDHTMGRDWFKTYLLYCSGVLVLSMGTFYISSILAAL